ncbi:hypothetical protein M430DRAFT_31976 [Amorphotheca resinae ATCC 22711]|uniref:Uncharacterized protein n=1 Tax=Amorphotheca resinae ATCC 22711 TaxID=857342 RepID=A0A2T3BCG1_AMORE|nr:hypothetical protein M430DRAFT_31976 [Amorphotheca resinae ATCC 22711]PSS27097.1 hypothetical protein M430DRAFT_31976 [Amorphotheca resinae ATCC 22711]
MLSSSSLSLIFVAGAVAQSQNLFAPSFPVVAYQLASTPNVATTYLVGCPAGSDTKSCNFVQPYTLVQGPATVDFALAVPGAQAVTLGCNLEGTTSMACSATGQPTASGSGLATAFTTFTADAASTHFRAISMVTDAAALMTFPTPSSTSTSTPTPTPTTPTTTPTPTSTSSSSSSTSTSSTSSSSLSIPPPPPPLNTTTTHSKTLLHSNNTTTYTPSSLITPAPVLVTSISPAVSGANTTALSLSASPVPTSAKPSPVSNSGARGSWNLGAVVLGFGALFAAGML